MSMHKGYADVGASETRTSPQTPGHLPHAGDRPVAAVVPGRLTRASSRWTGAEVGTILGSMTAPAPRCPTCGSLLAGHDDQSLVASGDRLTPWMIHDLPRIAWIVEYRAGELTDDERQIVRDATARMLRALELDSV